MTLKQICDAFAKESEHPPKLPKPQPGPQTKFLESTADIVIYGGAAGGGKSFALLLELAKYRAVSGFRGVLFRRTMAQAKKEGSIFDDSMNVLPQFGAKANLTTATWTYPSGAKVQFSGLEHEKDKLQFQGTQYAFIGFDELTHFTESQFWYLLSRNRSTCGVRPYVRATTNPGPGWVKKLLAPWIDKKFPNPATSGEVRWFRRENNQIVWLDEKPEHEPCTCLKPDCYNCFPSEKSLTFIRAQVFDNQELLTKDPAYLANLRAQDEVDRRALLDGEWDVEIPDRVLDGFTEAGNVIPWFEIPAKWKRYAGVDFGLINGAELAVAEDPDTGKLYVYGENWPGHSRHASQRADDIRTLVGRMPDLVVGGNRTTEQDSRELLKREGLPATEPRIKEVSVQYQCMNDEFRAHALFVLDNCPKTIQMLLTFQHDRDREGVVTDKFNDAPFHLLACGRYIVSHLRPPKVRKRTKLVGEAGAWA
jgi:hypothetical protein